MGMLRKFRSRVGASTYIAGDVLYFADSRMHASMAASEGTCTDPDGGTTCNTHNVDSATCTAQTDSGGVDACVYAAPTTSCKIKLGDMSTPMKSSMILKSIPVGIDTSMACLTLTANPATCTDPNGGTDCNTHNADKATCIANVDAGTNTCVYNGVCGSSGVAANTVRAFHHVGSTDDDEDGMVSGLRMTLECDADQDATKVTITAGGMTDTDLATGKGATVNLGTNTKILAGNGIGSISNTADCMNNFYYQFGFYSTGTPRFSRDLAQNNHDMGKTPKDEQVTLYGMKNHMQYQYRGGTAKMATDSFFGLGREAFTDLNSGMGTFDAGYSITEAGNDAFPQMTASVIAGENGAGAYDHSGSASENPMMEHAEKGAYIGRGYDKLTVTPMPDAMSAQKVTITYTGPSAGCSVTEVDRGTHESSECSGRGNCDYSTGTCLCDAGYTLEACSEQTVLV